jgi:hypothetical protein
MRSTSVVCLLALAQIGCGSGVTSSDAGDPSGSGGATASGTTTVAVGSGATGGTGSGGSGSGGSGGSGGSAPTCPAPENAASFEVGTGEKCFTRLSAGGDIPLMNGPQGGYHLWVAVGCSDCASPTHIRWGARDPLTGGVFPGTGDSEAMFELDGAAWKQSAGIFLYMPGLSWDPEYSPPPAKDAPIVIWSEVVEGTIVKHASEVEVKIGDTVPWDPCIETPEAPECQYDGRN